MDNSALKSFRNKLYLIIFSIFLLTACGGGSGSDPDPEPDPASSSNWNSMKWDQGKWE